MQTRMDSMFMRDSQVKWYKGVLWLPYITVVHIFCRQWYNPDISTQQQNSEA